MWAAYKGRVDMVSCLLDCGARINECETRRARTALYLACEFDHAPVVALLLTRGANPTLAAQRGEGGRAGKGGRAGREGREGGKQEREMTNGERRK
jgi:ankyrin repeat protein